MTEYAQWNPNAATGSTYNAAALAPQAGLTYSDGGYTVAANDTTSNEFQVSLPYPITTETGKVYVELLFNQVSNNIKLGAFPASPTYEGDNWNANYEVAGVLWTDGGGVVFVNGEYTGVDFGYNVSDPGYWLGYAYDPVANLIWVRAIVGGTPSEWNLSGTANPALGLGGIDTSGMPAPLIFGVAIQGDADLYVSVNSGQTAYAAAAPTGFANLPVPQVAATLEQPVIMVVT